MRLCSTNVQNSINCHVFVRVHFHYTTIITTARKRSFVQGDIFIGVCQEFCSQGGYLVPGVTWFWGGSWYGGTWSRGDLVRGGTCSRGRELPGGDPLRTAIAAGSTHPTGMHSCWWHFVQKLRLWTVLFSKLVFYSCH